MLRKLLSGESSPNQSTILLTLSCNSLTYLYKNSSKQHPQDIDTFTKQPRHPHRPTKWATASPGRAPRAAPLPMGTFLPLLLPGIIVVELEPRTISVTLQLDAFSTPILPIRVLGSTHLGIAFSLEMLQTQPAEYSSKRNPMASQDSTMGHGLGCLFSQ